MLRRHVKWHLKVTEQFIWKHIQVVQERMKVFEIPSEEQLVEMNVFDIDHC